MKQKTSQFLKSCINRIVSGYKPERIVLFGSYAYGKPNTDSDLDILVVKKTRHRFADRIRRVSELVGEHLFPLDFIVLTPKEIKSRLKDFDPFLEEVTTKGRTVYEKTELLMNAVQ